MKPFLFRVLLIISLLLGPLSDSLRAETAVQVGVAKVEITPPFPIQLSGYNGRPGEASEVVRPLFARALALGGGESEAVVLIAVEAIGVTQELSSAVADSLFQSHGLERSEVAVIATHIHTGPSIEAMLPFLFGRELPDDETRRIQAYTEWLERKLIDVGRAALDDRQSSRLDWGEGEAGFAVNRRKIVDGKWVKIDVVPDGSVDHALPVLRVTGQNGELRAVFASYACHCTTLRSEDNFIHSGWAGEAAARLESRHPGMTAMIGIGCGADANPITRNGLKSAQAHGAELAAEVERVLRGRLTSLGSVSSTRYEELELALDREVGAEELRETLASATRQSEVYSSTKFLEELDAGRSLPDSVPYQVQTWSFGEELGMVFLAGEVVSEYSLRLKRETAPSKLWVNAYANSVPSYIASESMYSEGGYEVDHSMHYYAWPTRLASGTEDHIIDATLRLLPAEFVDRTE